MTRHLNHPRNSALFDSPLASELTPKAAILDRRAFLAGLGLTGIGLSQAQAAIGPFKTQPSSFSTTETPTSKANATTYNNFYEFGLDKSDPAEQARNFKPEPWTITVEGACAKPRTFALDDILKLASLEDRIYRHRCVEGWSMVIPWIGLPLSAVINAVEPTSSAKFVAFETLLAPDRMPGQRRSVLDWPYREGLRIDEAAHPLALLAVGMYGEALPNQNGAPLRLVVPWKYGFKGIKSIVKIKLQESEPKTAWKTANAREYGFYSNVNPSVDHPRWSQATERRIGEFTRRPTLMFNGYGDQVASLYTGMDLKANY